MAKCGICGTETVSNDKCVHCDTILCEHCKKECDECGDTVCAVCEENCQSCLCTLCQSCSFMYDDLCPDCEEEEKNKTNCEEDGEDDE